MANRPANIHDAFFKKQLLRYITRILADWHRNNKRLPLPPVIPLLAEIPHLNRMDVVLILNYLGFGVDAPQRQSRCATGDENTRGAAQTSDLCDYLRGKWSP